MKVICICLFLFASVISFCQSTNDLTNYPGTWIYTNDNLSKEYYGEKFYSMNAEELQKYHSTTKILVDFLHQQPVAEKPLGVTLNVKARAKYIHYDHVRYPVRPQERVKSEVFIQFCNLFLKNGKIDHACDEVSFIDLITNDETEVYEPAMTYDLLDDKQAVRQFAEIFYLPKQLLDLGSGVYLYDWYYKNRVIIARNDRPIWQPITYQEYINRMMIYYNASLKEGKINEMVMDALKKEIGTIPPEIMNEPAYLEVNDRFPLTSVATGSKTSAGALYKLNPDYFDRSLNRTKVQLITINIEGHADIPSWGEVNAHRVWEFISGMKGEELRKLLDVK